MYRVAGMRAGYRYRRVQKSMPGGGGKVCRKGKIAYRTAVKGIARLGTGYLMPGLDEVMCGRCQKIRAVGIITPVACIKRVAHVGTCRLGHFFFQRVPKGRLEVTYIFIGTNRTLVDGFTLLVACRLYHGIDQIFVGTAFRTGSKKQCGKAKRQKDREDKQFFHLMISLFREKGKMASYRNIIANDYRYVNRYF